MYVCVYVCVYVYVSVYVPFWLKSFGSLSGFLAASSSGPRSLVSVVDWHQQAPGRDRKAKDLVGSRGKHISLGSPGTLVPPARAEPILVLPGQRAPPRRLPQVARRARG